MVDIFTSGPESSPPCGAACTLAHICANARSMAIKVPCVQRYQCCVCGWLAGFNPRANRQTAGVSVNSVVSCVLHTSGMSSPFIRHELLWRGQNCEETKTRRRRDGWRAQLGGSRNRLKYIVIRDLR